MKIALFLSSDALALAHRQPNGLWAMIGETGVHVPDLEASIADLRALAVEREGEDFETLLVLPDDQILYTSLTAPTGDPELTAFRIEDGLDGLTPYAVTELHYDWRETEPDRVKIAVVAAETLEEARGFATGHGFTPAGFAAMPPMERFPGVPVFDLNPETVAEMAFSAEGIAFGPDMYGLPEPEPEPEPEEQIATGQDQVDTGVDAAPFDDAPAEPAPEPQPEPEPFARDDETFAADENFEAGGLADALEIDGSTDFHADTDPQTEPDPQPQTEDAWPTENEAAPPLAPIEDPSLSGPISPLPDADLPSYSGSETAPDGFSGDLSGDPDDGDLPPVPAPAVRAARERARAERDGSAPSAPQSPFDAAPEGTATQGTPPQDAANTDPGPPAALARRLKRVSNAASKGRGKSLDGPLAPSGVVPPPPRARVEAPQRLPDTATGALAERPNPFDGPPPPAGGGATGLAAGLLAGLGRIRNRAAPTVAPQNTAAQQNDDAQTAFGVATSETDGTTSDAAMTPTRDAPTLKAEANPAASGGLFRHRSDKAPLTARQGPAPGVTAVRNAGMTLGPTSQATAALDPMENQGDLADEALPDQALSGLLARKQEGAVGPSFRFGLILTVILLVLLALVAIWSAVFLPNSAVARWMGLSPEAQVAVAPAEPPALGAVSESGAITAPEVVAIAPRLGAGAEGTASTPTDEPTFIDEAAADGIVLEPGEGEENGISAPDALDLDAVAEEAVEGAATAAAALAAASGLEGALTGDDATAAAIAAGEIEAAADGAPEQVLPDIDADLDLPPLPSIDPGLNPSLEEAQALYAEDGIWARSPERPDLQPFDLLDRIYTASIDPEISGLDAVALPDPGVDPNVVERLYTPPPAFGTEFDLTEQGLVAPSVDGALTPEGVTVIAGTPSVVALPRPGGGQDVAPGPEIDTESALLAAFPPTQRPEDLGEIRERQIQGGFTTEELSDVRPPERPASPQEVAAQASLFPGDTDETAGPDDTATAPVAIENATALAVASSVVPPTRPSNIAEIVASADRQPTEAPTAVAATAVAPGPSIPSNADVSRAATQENAIRLRNVNLIGVSGTTSERRALVRLSSGRFVRVAVGDRLDGGRVAAIGETTLQYVRNGRTVTLEVPG